MLLDTKVITKELLFLYKIITRGVMVRTISKQMKDNGILLDRLISLREMKEKTNSNKDRVLYDKCFAEALSKFNYIVDLHTSKYNRFSNYSDLRQEGRLGLVMSLIKFDPNKSKNFFKLANWYIKTRVKRAAKKHDVMRAPINTTNIVMSRVSELPIMIDKEYSSDETVERKELLNSVRLAIDCLSDIHKNVICMYYGINSNNYSVTNIKKLSLTTIAKRMKLPKENIEIILEEAYNILSCNQSMVDIAE